MDLLFRRQSNGLLPDSEEAGKAFYAIPAGSRVLVQIKYKDPRSVQQHRLFFGALHMIYENTEHPYKSFDTFRTAIQCALGWVETLEIKGQSITVPKSLSFAKMPQAEFQERVKEFEDWIKTTLWPGETRSLAEMVAAYQEAA